MAPGCPTNEQSTQCLALLFDAMTGIEKLTRFYVVICYTTSSNEDTFESISMGQLVPCLLFKTRQNTRSSSVPITRILVGSWCYRSLFCVT